MTNNFEFNVEFIEKDLVQAELIEKELVQIGLTTIDVIRTLGELENLIINEVPSQLTSTRFRTVNAYISGSLIVFFNGIKEKNITENSSTEFSLPIDFIVGDEIEIIYIKP